jgi:hypothetical protein
MRVGRPELKSFIVAIVKPPPARVILAPGSAYVFAARPPPPGAGTLLLLPLFVFNREFVEGRTKADGAALSMCCRKSLERTIRKSGDAERKF